MEEGGLMNILSNGVDISPSVQPTSLLISDRSGGIPDSIGVLFSDTEGQWSQWKPSKNDTLQIKQNGFNTGIMYIDELAQGAGVFETNALSIPQKCKTHRSQGWENVRFMEIVSQIAARYGFRVQTYNVINHLYERVDQNEEADLSFLAFRCMLEGYALKINNRNLVIYDEAKEEQKEPKPIIYQSNMHGSFNFRSKSTDIFEKCIIHSQTLTDFIKGEFVDSSFFGPTIKKNLFVSNQDEANRWSKGILRSFNKYAITGKFSIDLNLNLASGTCIGIQDTGMFDGKYFIDQLTHDLINNRTKLMVRKPLEGY
jgi:uncharacterized protein